MRFCLRIPSIGKIAVTEGAVGRHRDAVLLAPRKYRMLNGALLQIIEHLIAGKRHVGVDRSQILQVTHVEITDAPGPDLAAALQDFAHGGPTQPMFPRR